MFNAKREVRMMRIVFNAKREVRIMKMVNAKRER